MEEIVNSQLDQKENRWEKFVLELDDDDSPLGLKCCCERALDEGKMSTKQVRWKFIKIEKVESSSPSFHYGGGSRQNDGKNVKEPKFEGDSTADVVAWEVMNQSASECNITLPFPTCSLLLFKLICQHELRELFPLCE